MQTAADVANMLFDVPDGFAASATAAKQRQIVTVTLRMIAGDQAQQRRFSRAVRASDLPVIAWVYRPAQLVKDGRSL
jgi:hypothetical protein